MPVVPLLAPKVTMDEDHLRRRFVFTEGSKLLHTIAGVGREEVTSLCVKCALPRGAYHFCVVAFFVRIADNQPNEKTGFGSSLRAH
jgi:hypothetical protein